MNLQLTLRCRASTFEHSARPGWPSATILAVVAWLLLVASLGFGQEADPTKSGETEPAAETIVAADIEAALKQVDDDKDIDDATKAQLRELYAQAKVKLDEALKQQETAAQFKSWVADASKDIEEAQQQKGSPPPAYDLDAAKNLDLNQLAKDSTSLEQQLTDTKKLLSEAQREPQRRVDRKAALPAEIAAAQTALMEIDKDLKAVESASDPPIVLRARFALLLTRRQAQLSSIAALESERDAYEAQGELPRLRIDLATARVKQLEQGARDLVRIITGRRKMDAAAQKEDAEKAFRAVPQQLQQYAQESINYVNRRIGLANDIRNAATDRDRIGRELERWQRDFERTRSHAETGRSDTIGLMLIEKRDSLPSISLKRSGLTDQEKKLRELQDELYRLEDRREDLSDIDAAVKTEVSELRGKGTELPDGAETLLEDLFTLEVPILDSLLKDANWYYSLQIAARADQQELVRVVQEYREFVDARVFKVRCAAPLGLRDLTLVPAAFRWLANVDEWGEVGEGLVARVRKGPLATLLYAGVLASLFFFRRRIRSKLTDLGRVASSISCRETLPTTQALLLTALLAVPWPLLAWGVGWGLGGAVSEPIRVVSSALSYVAIWLLILESIRQICCPHGLAEAHFGWSARGMSVVQSGLRVLGFAGAPFVVLTMIFELQRNAEYRASVGRLALIALHLLVALICYRMFRPRSGVFAEKLEQNPNGWLNRWQRVWYPIIVLTPFVLAVLAMMGFQYTSSQLTLDLWRTFALIFSLCVLGALMSRWVRLQRRRLRWQQLMAARQRSAEEDDSETSDLEALAAREGELDLVAMDQQSRRLISASLVCFGLISLSAIWSEAFAAMTPLLDKELWSVAEAGGGVRAITYGAVLFSALVVALTIVASRNIPGLIDVVLLGRLGIESSTRYAVSTLSQYAIVIVGILVALYSLGFTWDKAQWLIAALSVGLGFGLQEVVANFVCGILLLFECPIRVGDTVTLGETTGVVIRIRSRATTVRNWDRQEVVIPNKELITGRIVNWTLTDELNRIVVQVGIAYGSDTNHARELLRQILEENSNVVDDPRPLVTFEQFGDSALNFSARAYLANMDQRLETIHDLHTSINQRFAEEGIEIAFPQRDLHIRSVDQPTQRADGVPERTWGVSPDETAR